MTTQQLAVAEPSANALMEVLANGNIAVLSPQEKLNYLQSLCQSLGLNPLTRPFQFLQLSGKHVLYATKDATDQLRKIHGVSVRIVAREVIEGGVFAVTAQATDKGGRTDESIGAVAIGSGVTGESRANAVMKAETKAKRRVTLSICGLGLLDETEIDSIPGAQVVNIETGELTPVKQRTASPSAPTPAVGQEAARRAFYAAASKRGLVFSGDERATREAVNDALGIPTDKGILSGLAERFGYDELRHRLEDGQDAADLLASLRGDAVEFDDPDQLPFDTDAGLPGMPAPQAAAGRRGAH